MSMTRRRHTIRHVHIRPLIETGIHGVEEIEALAFAGPDCAYKMMEPREIYDAATAGGRHRAVIARLEPGHDQDQILGWAFYRRDQHSTTIIRVAVHPSSWMRGVGRMLVDHIQAEESHVVGASIDDEDHDTAAFLEALGFTPAGHRVADGRTLDHYVKFLRRFDRGSS